MDNLLDDLEFLIRRCENVAGIFEKEPFKSQQKAISEVADRVGESWSGSYLGYHANTYYEGLKKPPIGGYFDSEWGFQSVYSNRTSGIWKICNPTDIISQIYELAGNPDLDSIEQATKEIQQVFEASKDELLASLDAFLARHDDQRIRELRDSINKLSPYIDRTDFFAQKLPRQQLLSADSLAQQQGPICPPHLEVLCILHERRSYGFNTKQLARLSRQAKLYLEKSLKMKGATVAKKEGKIFIGHGRSSDWKEVKDFLKEKLDLEPDEFNLSSAAGIPVTERLQNMLDSACFAFLVMTAEDEVADGSLHARQNVIHEAGLFQGRLGFKRAILLVEEGCKEFSNIEGLGQIRFQKENIKSTFEGIRDVLRREGIIK